MEVGYSEIYHKKKEQSVTATTAQQQRSPANRSRPPERRKDNVARYRYNVGMDTPVDPSELSESDRKRLLEKRIEQLEDNERFIRSLQVEMAANTAQQQKPMQTDDQSYYRQMPSDQSRHRSIPSDQSRHRPMPSDQSRHRSIPSDQSRRRPMQSDQSRGRPMPSDQSHRRSLQSDQSRHRYIESNQPRHVEGRVRSDSGSDVTDDDNYYEDDQRWARRNMAIPELEVVKTESEKRRHKSRTRVSTRGVQNVRRAGRNYRKSVMSNAQRILNERQRRSSARRRATIIRNTEKMLRERDADFEYSSSSTEDEIVPPVSHRRPPSRRASHDKVITQRSRERRSRSRSPQRMDVDVDDDDYGEFIEVPEYLDSETSSLYQTCSLPPPPRGNRFSRFSRFSDVPSAVQSEIPIIETDDDEAYPETRPLTDTERNRYPNYRRYEGDGLHQRVNYRDPAHKKVGRMTGALVRFFRNGDPDHKGVPLTVNRSFKNIETLLVYLNDKIPTPTGVKYIYKWPEGTEMKSVTEFQNRCVYVVTSTKKLSTEVNYGESRESFWSNKKPSAGRLRKNELGLYQKPLSPKGSPVRNAPLIVTIINNLGRDKREKVILNPSTQQSWEDWLVDISNHDLPVKSLFSEKPPYSEIKSFSQLFRELRLNSNFIACGDESLPVELSKKRQAPSSNSSTDSIHEARNRKKKLAKNQEMGQIYENGRPDSPTSTVMSRYDFGPRYPLPGKRPQDSRRTIRDNVEIEIDGVCKEFIPPSYVDPEDDGTKPDLMLKCDWVYGFRGRDSRHNLLVLPKTGELVYHMSAVVVLYDSKEDTQRHYTKHNEEITCMTIHPIQDHIVATGQMHGRHPEHASHIRIWDGGSLSTYAVIGLNVFYGGIMSIGFSEDGVGSQMCVLDGSEKHVLSVWDWDKGRIIARTTTSTDEVHCACFYPDGNNSILVTYGNRHIYFWKIFYDVARKKEAKILRDRNSGIFEDDIPKAVNSIVFLPDGDVVSADTNGNLMVWDRDATDAFTCKYVIQAHSGSIACICLLEDGTLLSASGNEVRAWDSIASMKPVKTRQIPQEAGNIRSIVTHTVGGNDGKLFIGTSNSAILDGCLQGKFRYIVQGHTDGVWGVTPHPVEPTFISAGFDRLVYKWSLVNHKVIWRTQVESPCTAVAIDHSHELVAIGTAEGTFIILNNYNGVHIATVEVGTESIGCVSFSPDGMLLAIGCSDGCIHMHEMRSRGQMQLKTTLSGHTTGVVQLDWSRDGRSIQSVSFDHELIFWDVDSMQQIKIPRMMRDVDWFTNTCHVSYALIGPWSNLHKGETLKVVNTSNRSIRPYYTDMVVTGDSRGRLRLYKYPSSKEKSEYRSARIYSTDVTAVAFTPDNRSLLSCGGYDAAMCQWSLVEDQL